MPCIWAITSIHRLLSYLLPYYYFDSHNTQVLPPPSLHRCLIWELENVRHMPKGSELVRAKLYHISVTLTRSPALLPLSASPLLNKHYDETVLLTRAISGRLQTSNHLWRLSPLNSFSLTLKKGHISKKWASTQQKPWTIWKMLIQSRRWNEEKLLTSSPLKSSQPWFIFPRPHYKPKVSPWASCRGDSQSSSQCSHKSI